VRPIIGLTCGDGADSASEDVGLPGTYARSVYRAGGLPVLIAPPREDADADALTGLLERIDGLLVPGGVDVDPRHFGEPPHAALGRVSPDRDALEIPLIRAALRRGTPILAICRGIQVLNVAAGGSLYQDLAAQVPGAIQHRQAAPRWHASHTVAIAGDSRLARILGGEQAAVNSFHHQAVKELAPGFVATAAAPDGVIEGIECPEHPFAVGVQWHPEGMWVRHPVMLELFTALVLAAMPAGAPRGR
jgi:putative glutamine amidotransferase